MYTLKACYTPHYPTLLATWEASVRATHLFLEEEEILFYKQTIQEHKVFDNVALTLAYDGNDSIAGFMGTSGDSLEMLFLDPNHIGKGLGKKMMRHAIDILNVTRVDVNEQNIHAATFYQRCGFSVVSRSELDGTGRPYPILHMQL